MHFTHDGSKSPSLGATAITYQYMVGNVDLGTLNV